MLNEISGRKENDQKQVLSHTAVASNALAVDPEDSERAVEGKD